MFSLYGAGFNVRNVCLVSIGQSNGADIGTLEELRDYYLNFLESHQPQQVVNKTNEIFVYDDNISEKLRNAYHKSSLNDLNQQQMIGEVYTDEEKVNLRELINNGYEFLVSVHPELKELFNLCIHSIFFRKSGVSSDKRHSFGGSSSTAIGTIWVSGHGTLNKYDVAEFLLHELTHHLLFIDERCHEQFNYNMMIQPENYAQSAILNKKRPLDKVVHSIVVGTEILLARRSFLGEHKVNIHPNSVKLQHNVISSIDDVFSLPKIDNIITLHTREILEKCKIQLTTIN